MFLLTFYPPFRNSGKNEEHPHMNEDHQTYLEFELSWHVFAQKQRTVNHNQQKLGNQHAQEWKRHLEKKKAMNPSAADDCYLALDSEFRNSVPGLQTIRVLMLRPLWLWLWFWDFDVIETDKPAQLMFQHPNLWCFAPQEKKETKYAIYNFYIKKILRYSAFWSENQKGFQNAKMDITSLSSII
jgi:hypothetical protein